jgi:hypothetical protein
VTRQVGHAGVCASDADLAAILRGHPLSADEIARLAVWGFALMRADELVALRRAVSYEKLANDIDLLAEVVVAAFWADRAERRTAA